MSWLKKKYYEVISAKQVEVLSEGQEGYSLIISSFSREGNVEKILKNYCDYGCFTEIIIWHNGAKPLTLHQKPPLVRIINSDDMGLSSRYAAGLLAKASIVFLHDDDLLVPEETFITMAKRHQEERCTTTLGGKTPHADGTYGKGIKPALGKEKECEIHLNRCICTSRAIIPAYFEFLFKTNLTLDPTGGGGEDIVYSYAARLLTGKKPIAIGLPYTNLDEHEAISSRFGNQHKNRTQIMKVCQKVFEDEITKNGK